VALNVAVKVIGAFVVVDSLIIVDVAIKRLYFNCVVVYERFTADVEVVVPCDTDTLVVVWVVVKDKVVVWETVWVLVLVRLRVVVTGGSVLVEVVVVVVVPSYSVNAKEGRGQSTS
jgi:hypothetical protein